MVKRFMTTALLSLDSLSNEQLLARVKTLSERERHATAALIAALTELDVRRLYLGEGYPSLFAYCTQALHLSEDAAYNRIRAARAAAKWPIVLEMIADGSVTVTTVRLLSEALTDTNHLELLRAARHKSKRAVEEVMAALRPRPPVAPLIRKVATPAPAPVPRASISPPPGAQPSATSGEPTLADHLPQPARIAKPPSVALGPSGASTSVRLGQLGGLRLAESRSRETSRR